jgi:hypothetical protein
MPGDSVMVTLHRQQKEGEVRREIKTDATTRANRKYLIMMRDDDNKELEVTYNQLSMNNEDVVEVAGEERFGTKKRREKNALPDPPPPPEFKGGGATPGVLLTSHYHVVLEWVVTVRNKGYIFGLNTKAVGSNSRITQFRVCVEEENDLGPKHDDLTIKDLTFEDLEKTGDKMTDSKWACTNGKMYQNRLNDAGQVQYKVGEAVEAAPRGASFFRAGKIVKLSGRDTYDIKFDDNGEYNGETALSVKSVEIKKVGERGRRNSLLSVKRSKAPKYDAEVIGENPGSQSVTIEEVGNGKESKTHCKMKLTGLEAATMYKVPYPSTPLPLFFSLPLSSPLFSPRLSLAATPRTRSK